MREYQCNFCGYLSEQQGEQSFEATLRPIWDLTNSCDCTLNMQPVHNNVQLFHLKEENTSHRRLDSNQGAGR